MKICVITDMDSTNSGYRTIAAPLLTGLTGMGYEIKVCGISYRGEEHSLPFSVIPAGSVQDALGIATNINFLWNPDIFLFALDIPLQQVCYDNLKNTGKKYVSITPLENPPLTPSWANILVKMDFVFFISELGKQEAIKAGLINVEHLEVGIDTVIWHPPTGEERATIRKNLGIDERDFVVLTVADNQERKNIWGGMAAVSILKKMTQLRIHYFLVTRKDSPFGWKFPDLPLSLDLAKETQIFERGLPQKDLWGLFSASDIYLQPSKAEGLGLPVMEAMACGIPVVATDTGALHELLENGRGFLVDSAYRFLDVWGNEYRDMIDTEKATEILRMLSEDSQKGLNASRKSLTFIKSRTFEKAVQQVHKAIEGLFNEQK